MESILGLFVSMLYIGLIIGIATRLTHLPYEMSRTFAHIMVANWWLLATWLIKDYRLALVAPVFFIIFNSFNVVYNWIPAINTKRRHSNWGTIHYAVAFLLITALTFHIPNLHIVGGVGLLVMAYGDGVAAIIGQFFGKHPYTIFKGHKTLEGSFAMFITSMLVIGIYQLFVYQSLNWMHIGSLALVATLVEAISPHGNDNLFIPMLVSLLYFILIL